MMYGQCDMDGPSGTGEFLVLLKRQNERNEENTPSNFFYGIEIPPIAIDRTPTVESDNLWEKPRGERDNRPRARGLMGEVVIVDKESINRIERLRKTQWKPYDKVIDDSFFEF